MLAQARDLLLPGEPALLVPVEVQSVVRQAVAEPQSAPAWALAYLVAAIQEPGHPVRACPEGKCSELELRGPAWQ